MKEAEAALWLDWVCGDRSEKRWLLLLFDSNEENQAPDIKAAQKDRAETSSGWRTITHR
jgi:hypothetical protein